MALGLDLAELSKHLRQERLFVTSEREQLQNLYEQVKMSAEQLYHQSWIGRQQKDILDLLIRSSQQVTPSQCCSQTNQLESLNFVDGYKHLSYHDSKYGEFMKFLVENPTLLGQIFYVADQNNVANVQEMVKVLMHSVFGNCVLQEDETSMLHLLKTLLDLQVAPCDNPRRMLRRGSSAFSIAFKQLFDVVFSAKLFLTAALHDPVMRLLMEDEWFYDIDPGKALVRFPPQERLRRFGEPGTDSYKDKLVKYRKTIVEKLVLMASRFITSIKNNMHCFPPSLGWIISQVYQTLAKSGKVEMGEVRAVCADLVFALFICPAICDPEPYGITTDVPISHIARHNLMQMAQIIQVLAISRWEEIDSKQHDLYGKFEKGCMSTLLDSLLDGIGVELPSTNNAQLPCLTRMSSLIQLSQLNTLISFLRSSLPFVEDSTEKKCLDELLTSLVSVTPQTPLQNPLASIGAPINATPPGTPATQKKQKTRKKMSVASVMSQISHVSDETASISSMSLETTEAQPTNQQEDVLIICLGSELECPGMMSEQKVISFEQENKRRRVKYQAVPGGYEVGTVEIQEKRTRFSLSHDQESIGNTSDIPEAISEGASSHSVGSQDLENDDDNDNFSDMISANVSGRGTPNISGSGRDTPLSQAESGEQEVTPHPQPALPDTVQKKNREDVTEKFGKFEIKELDYDLKSTVSDTWSTDVLASDSEPPEVNQSVRLEEIAEEMVRQQLLGTRERVSEISETASDAWSTDVLASDNEEKQAETFSEFDDMSSMAETASNLDDVRSECDIAEGNEVTPLASGFQSPNETTSADMFPSSSHGGGGTSVTSDNASMSPTFSDSVFSDIDVDTRTTRGPRTLPGNSLLMDSNRLFVPIKKKRAPSPPGSSPDRGSDIGGYASNSSNRNRLVDFDLEPRTASTTESYNRTLVEMDGLNLVSNNAIAGDTGARPKTQTNGNNVSWSDRKSKKNVSNLKLKENYCDVQNGLFMSEESRPLSKDSGVGSSQFIESEESCDVKLSEQQNVNVDENRFSAALSLFDPLTQDENTMASGDLLEGATSPPPGHAFQSFTNPNFQENSGAEPLISIQNEKGTSQYKFELPSSEVKQNGAVSDSCDMYIESGTHTKRRGSTDSNQSSGSSLSKDDSACGDRLSLDNASQRVDEKDLPNGDENVTPGKKKGLFKTFKDKIHKGIKKKGTRLEKEPITSADSSVLDGSGVDGSVKGAEPNIIITEANNVDPDQTARMCGLNWIYASHTHDLTCICGVKETSDDILAKYRKKSILTSTPSSEPTPSERERRLTLKDSDDTTPLYDPNNLENCLAFLDAKRKLRIVLGSADFQQVGYGIFAHSTVTYSPREIDMNRDNNDLVNLLRTQLSEAINLQNKDTIAQLHEALRCVRQFDSDGCKKLVKSLQEEYRSRSSYISYLVRCKQGLLNTLSHINRLQNRIKREKEIYNKHMTSVCVRLFLEYWEKHVISFIADFQKLTVSDEKTDLLERFLEFLYQNMNRDTIWQAASENQLDDARLAIERYLMSRIYTHAMFPNGDGDILRDQILQQHIKELSKIITADHKDLKIPKMYHLECPWPAAQRELYMINAYKTPKDKLKCVQRCAATIMNLLSMANEKSVPAADDFTPVFIFVIIKANPPCLLSTIQYVNSFYQDRLEGEEHYWWMQFVAAVEFIKTMDYPRESVA